MGESGQGILTSQSIHHECSYYRVMSCINFSKKTSILSLKKFPKKIFHTSCLHSARHATYLYFSYFRTTISNNVGYGLAIWLNETTVNYPVRQETLLSYSNFSLNYDIGALVRSFFVNLKHIKSKLEGCF